MLEIQEKTDGGGYETVREWAGGAELHITEALDRNSVCGFVAYAYDKNKTVIYAYDSGGDIVLCDGLIRSVMLKSTLKNINTVEFRLADRDKLTALRRLRFIADGETVSQNIDRFMNGCKECGRS